MRVGSVQNLSYNKQQANFGCNYCKLTKEVLSGCKGENVEAILKKVNPEMLDTKTSQIMRENGITPMELHLMRAQNIYEGLLTTKKHIKPGLDLGEAIAPGGAEKIITAIRDLFDDQFSLRIGVDYFR